MVISVIHGIIYSEELSRWNIMKFDAVTIKNFRNFENITIDLTNKNVLFGMNDVGVSYRITCNNGNQRPLINP